MRLHVCAVARAFLERYLSTLLSSLAYSYVNRSRLQSQYRIKRLALRVLTFPTVALSLSRTQAQNWKTLH
jgi:hypothetical protein